MIIIFLGTGSAAPTPTRNVSAIALQFVQRGKWWLFDCGEGTQHQIMRSSLRVSQLEKIFITHLHGDHLYGLPGLLASRSLRAEQIGPLEIYGPPGLQQYLEAIKQTTPLFLSYALNIHEVSTGKLLETDDLVVSCTHVSHRVPTYAYAIEEKMRPGAFLSERAKAAGIPPGPLYGRLKRGEEVMLPDGRVYRGEEFVGPAQPGRKLVYSGDTQPCSQLVQLAQGADVLIHEATYAHADLPLARRSAHSTAREAAEVAAAAKVGQLILTHFSQRYADTGELTIAHLWEDARQLFPQTILAEDFLQVPVPRKRLLDAGANRQ